MATLKVFFVLLLICVAKGDFDYKASCTTEDYRDLRDNRIENVMEYCRDKLCVIKCCRDGMLLSHGNICMTEQALQKRNKKYAQQIKEQHNYDIIKLYTKDGYGVKESKKEAREIEFIYRENYTECSYDMTNGADFHILEDGSLRLQRQDTSKAWYDMSKLSYCVEYKLFYQNRTQILTRRELVADPDDAENKTIYALTGFIVSQFFLILTLLVYCVLPYLQNLIGITLMAYITTLISVFFLKCVIILTNISQTQVFCKIISSMLYFSAISSFFWLNVMAFDAYLSFSRAWSSRGSSKREIYRKFSMYALYAWGVPLIITGIVTVLDNIDVSELGINPTPPFSDCMPLGDAVFYYCDIPIGILISVNIILFILTVFNIWKSGRAFTKNPNSKKSNQNNMFYVCLKLSLITGVSWILELFEGKGVFVYILLNTYNLFSGAAIFFLFVFKKTILVDLCIRFNFDNEWVRAHEPSTRLKSGTTRSTRLTKSKNCSQTKETEMASMTNHNTKEESAAP